MLTLAIEHGEPDSVKHFTKQQLTQLVQIFSRYSSTNKESELYLIIAKILTSCGNKTSKSKDNYATILIKEKVHNILKNTIENRLSELSKNKSAVPQDQQNESDLDTNFFKRFAAEIELLAALFNTTEKRLIFEGLLENQVSSGEPIRNIPFTLVRILSRKDIIDPLLLTSLCKLALAMLYQKEISNKKDLLKDIVNGLDFCREILPYLGKGKFLQLKQTIDLYRESKSNNP